MGGGILAKSDKAFEILRDLGIRAKVILIDGAHETDQVRRDLENYWKLLAEGGTMFMDDYGMSSVNSAIMSFLPAESGLTVLDPDNPKMCYIKKAEP